jgi:hypothetical protein
MRRRGVLMLLAVAPALMTVVPSGAVVPGDKPPGSVLAAITAARRYAEAHGVTATAAVRDTRTEVTYAGPRAGQYFGSASVVKVFVATELLLTGQMHGGVARQATRMIEASDNDAYRALAPEVGGLDVINRVARHYDLDDLGRPPPKSKRWCWGNTQISALGMVEFYARIKGDRRVGPWLLNAMHHFHDRSSGGDDQTFGWPKADPGAAVKQGWGDCSSDDDGTEVNSTGTVDNDRFTVAILSNSRAFHGRRWLLRQGAVVSRMAKIIYAALQPLHNPTLHIDSMHVAGGTLRVAGWSFDPDAPARTSTISVSESRQVLGHATTTVLRRGVNRRYHLSGPHGFVLRVAVPTGHYSVCVSTPDVGRGTADARSCRPIRVGG